MGRVGRIVVSGVAAGTAYLVAQSVDLRVARNNVDDRIILAGVAPLSASRSRVVGTGLHLANSVALSAVFSMLVRPRLAGPDWWRGVIFASLANGVLYSLVLLEDFHPAIRDGRVDSYQSWAAFLQGVWRHIWFGAVLGAMSRK